MSQCDEEKLNIKNVESEQVIGVCEHASVMQQNKYNNRSLKNIYCAGNKTIKNYHKRLQRSAKPKRYGIAMENTDFYCLNIKASLSTTSLSQQKEQHRNCGQNGIIAKIKTDRPYHSLKKNIRHRSDCKLNHRKHLYNKRYSWSGGRYYKSSNLCGSALNGTTGKDDLWGAIQTNYNYIMDTDLLENCKDTHGEINGVPNLLGNPMDCSKILNVVERNSAASGDANELRQWLCKMEEKLQKTPTTSEASLYSVTELLRLSQEHAVLYHQIVSYALIVRACIRSAYAKEQERRSRCATLTPFSNVGMHNENCDCRSLIVIENRNPTATHLSYKIISTKRNNAGKSKVTSPAALMLKGQSSIKKTASKQSDFCMDSAFNVPTINMKDSLNSQFPSVCSYEAGKVNAIIDNGLYVGSCDSEDDFESLEKLQYRYYLIYLKAYEVQLLFDAILREKSTSLMDSKDVTIQPIGSLYHEPLHVPDVYITDNLTILPKDNVVNIGSKNEKSTDITTEAILEMIIKNKKSQTFKNVKEDMKLPSPVNVDTTDCFSQNNFCMLPQQTDKTIPDDLTTRTVSSYNIPPKTDRQMSVTDCEADSENSDLDASPHITQDSSTSSFQKNLRNNKSPNTKNIKREEKFFGLVKRNTNNLCKISQNNDFNLIYAFPNVSFEMEEVTQLQKQLNKKLLQQKLNKKIKNDGFSKINKLTKTTTSNITDYDISNKPFTQSISSKNGGGLLFDTTRFTHSNRKSKNCAIFYFKHMDSDENEQPCTSSGDAIPNKYDHKEKEIKLESLIDERIKKLVLDADELLYETTQSNLNQSGELNLKNGNVPFPVEELMEERKKKRVEEWLELQPDLLHQTRVGEIKFTDIDNNRTNSKVSVSADTVVLNKSDEEESKLLAETDTSDDFNDSIATCVRTSYCTSNEQMGESANMFSYECGSSNQSLNVKVVKREKNSKNHKISERPWSVSCFSHVNSENRRIAPSSTISTDNVKSANLAIHSISESALDSLSPNPCLRLIPHTEYFEGSNIVTSFRRRRVRKKKVSQNSAPQLYMDTEIGSASNDIRTSAENTLSLNFKSCATLSMFKSVEQIKENAMMKVLEHQLLPLDSDESSHVDVSPVLEANEMDEENTHMSLLRNTKLKIGTLSPPLKKYNNFYHNNQLFSGKAISKNVLLLMNEEDQQGGFTTGTDDHNSSFSETAWDDYQEKYNSENYSEGFDSDAARRLLEFGDDYRNFIDSQSDCCSSSFSAVNKIDSLSPPSINSLQEQTINAYSNQTSLAKSSNPTQHTLENTQSKKYQNNTKNKEEGKHLKNSSQNCHKLIDPTQCLGNTLEKKEILTASDKFKICKPVQLLRRSSESDTSIRRKKADTFFNRRRRSNLEKTFKMISTKKSTSDEDAEQQAELQDFLHQCRDRLESTYRLKFRCSLLRKDDYVEVIGICSDNICSLQAMLHKLSNSEASTSNNTKQIKDMIRSWRDLLHWNEIAIAARELLDDMSCLKRALNHLGSGSFTMLDTELFIQTAIESLKTEKLKLTAYRSQISHLNAAVHNWLIKHENELFLEQTDYDYFGKKAARGNEQHVYHNYSGSSESTTHISNDLEFHRKLRNEVSDIYLAWDVAESRITQQLNALKASLATWRQLDNGLSEFQQVLGKDRGTLEGLEGAEKLANNANILANLLLSKQSENQPLIPPYCMPKFAISTSCSSDSGISDGGAISDSGLSERENRLNVLRRLAKKLECTFPPSSSAMTSISARIESAEVELKQLQIICQVLIQRTENTEKSTKNNINKNKRHIESNDTKIVQDGKSYKKGVAKHCFNTPWYWRVAKFALPVHLAFLTLICLTVFLQPYCCDNMNSYYVSFIPQLRYIQGPPPY